MTEERQKELESYSQMLGMIGGLVIEFCDHPECTTLDAVKLMKAELLELKAYKMRNEVRNEGIEE